MGFFPLLISILQKPALLAPALYKFDEHTLYALLTDTSPGTTQSMSSSADKPIPILRGLKFTIFSTASSKIRWSDSS
jgi:hypothetical protein